MEPGIWNPALHAQWISFGSAGGPAPVTVTGSYRLLGQASSRVGTFSQKPPDLWRAEINPTLAIYGIPLTASFLVSSEQQGIQQNINAFSLTLDPDAIKRIVTQRAYRALEGYARSEAGDMLRDYDNVKDSLAQFHPDQLKELEQMRELEKMRDLANGNINGYEDVLNQMGLMSDVEQFMTNLPTVGVGNVFPTFTPITLSGARINGAWGEWNPGQVFYIAGVGGTTQRPLRRVDSIRVDTTVYTTVDNSNFGQSLYGGRLGVGNKDADHFIVTGIYSVDDASSLIIPDSGTTLTPKKNYLASMSLSVEPVPSVWTLEAEVAGSMTVGDQNAPKILSEGIPDFIVQLMDSSSSTYVDWAASATTTVNIAPTDTRLTASLRRIGAGYTALGVPNLRTDYFRYDVRLNQRVWKRQLTLGVFMRRDRDNLIPIKRATSSLFSIGATAALSIRRLPYLRVSYAPYVQESDATDTLLQFRNRTVLWSVAGGYAYRIGNLGANTNITISQQDAETKNNLYDYGVTSVNASQTISFLFPLSLTGGLGWIKQTSVQSPSTTIITVDLSAYYSFNDILSTNGGVNLALDDVYGTRSGYFLGVTARLGNYADIDIRAERNIFNEQVQPPVLGGSYAENIFRATISKYW